MTSTISTAIITTDIEWSDEEWDIVSAKAERAGLSVEDYIRALFGCPPFPEGAPPARSIAELTPVND